MRWNHVRTLLAVAVVAFAACSGDGGPVDPNGNGNGEQEPVATVTVTAPSGPIVAGQTKQLTVVLKDAAGTELTGRTVTFSSSS